MSLGCRCPRDDDVVPYQNHVVAPQFILFFLLTAPALACHATRLGLFGIDLPVNHYPGFLSCLPGSGVMVLLALL